MGRLYIWRKLKIFIKLHSYEKRVQRTWNIFDS